MFEHIENKVVYFTAIFKLTIMHYMTVVVSKLLSTIWHTCVFVREPEITSICLMSVWICVVLYIISLGTCLYLLLFVHWLAGVHHREILSRKNFSHFIVDTLSKLHLFRSGPILKRRGRRAREINSLILNSSLIKYFHNLATPAAAVAAVSLTFDCMTREIT